MHLIHFAIVCCKWKETVCVHALNAFADEPLKLGGWGRSLFSPNFLDQTLKACYSLQGEMA
jgi:hypothetical protein